MHSWVEIWPNIYDLMQIPKKNQHLRIYLIAHWTDIFIACISLNPIFTFLRQFYPGDLANFAGSTIIFFIAALIIRWFGQIVALSRWTWLPLLLSISSLTTVSYSIFFPLPFPPPPPPPLSPAKLFRIYFAVTNL